ncbi:MAG: hypothetical protein ABI452_04120 [Candidatus Limnocylindrales bacterium]
MGPTTDTGLPTSILGLPVYTVAGINQLAAEGKLDGRFAAVAGYWQQYALPCPYMPHQPPLSGFCYGGRFGDTPESVQGSGGIDGGAPLSVTETSGGDVLSQMPGGPVGPSAQVALIVHAGDPRSWQCDPGDQAACAKRLVIDRVVWAQGAEMGLSVRDDFHMTLDEVIAAAGRPDETVVLAYPINADSINYVDPRFIGAATDLVWYVRLITGAPDADGIVPGRDVLIGDATGAVVSELPLEVDPAYSPARLTLDSNGWAMFRLTNGTSVIATGELNSSLAPWALEPGDYSVATWAESGAILATPRPSPAQCSLDFSLAAGDDVTYYADWPHRGDCTWKEGSWPFN